MIIVPLVASSIITGVAGVGSGKSLGRLGRKTFLYYLATSTIAILTGLLLVNLITPGIQGGEPVRDKLGLTADLGDLEEATAGKGAGDLIEIFLRMVPTNPLAAAVRGEILPLIFFCFLFGFFLTRLPERLRTVLGDFWQAVFEVMMRVTNFVMLAAPFGVFGLVARTTAAAGLEAFGPLALYALTVALALAIHFLITLPTLLTVLGRVNPRNHYRAVAPALLTGFSTCSSSATLPLTMECVGKRAGVSNRVTSFVLPLGATVNMDGTALYECVAVVFIAQAYGIALGPMEQFVVVITALLASVGAAGIPKAGLVMMTIVLSAVGLPLEGVGVILAVDRVLDMSRTMVNIFSDTCGSIIIARSEGESGFYPQSANERTTRT